jgi:putative DNA primase/helicase
MDTRPAITLVSLAAQPIWVGWKNEARNGQPTEVPFDPKTGRLASASNAATWATHDEADGWAATNGADGVGLMFSQIGDAFIGGINLNGCRDPETEAIEPWAQAVIDRFETYTEASASLTGANLMFAFARADLPPVEALFGGKYVRMLNRANGNDDAPAIEIHRGHKHFAITGDVISKTDALRLVHLGDLEWLIRDHGPKFAGRGASARNASQQGDDSRSARALRMGVILAATGASYEDMRDALLTYADLEISDWARTEGMANGEQELHRIYEKARSRNPGVRLDHFVAYMQSSGYIYLPAGDFWPAKRVNARLPPVPQIDAKGQPVLDDKTGKQKKVRASDWLAEYAPVEQMTWVPGLPRFIDDRLVGDGGGSSTRA